MAKSKSKSTTTPTKTAFSSKNESKSHTDGGRSSKSNATTKSDLAESSPSKRKAENSTEGSRASKRRAAVDDRADTPQDPTSAKSALTRWKGKGRADDYGTDSDTRRATINQVPSTSIPSAAVLSDAEIFRRRHASMFRDPSVKVEEVEEQQPDSGNISAQDDPTPEADDQEKVLDSVLMGTFGSKSRRHAVSQLIHAARQSPNSAADIGLGYIEASLNRLKRKGVTQRRLAEIVVLLQKGFRETLVHFGTRVDFLGGTPPTPQTSRSELPERSRVAAKISTATKSSRMVGGIEPRSSPALATPTAKEKLAIFEAAHSSSDSSTSSSDDDEIIVTSSLKHSRYRDDDEEGYRGSGDRTGQNSEPAEHEGGMTSVQLTLYSQSHADNNCLAGTSSKFLLYGTRKSNGTPFDMFARCAISALMPAPGNISTAMQIREQSLRLWRRVSATDKEDWKILNEARVSDPGVYKKGGRLLETQGHLARRKPNLEVTANGSDVSQQNKLTPAVTKLGTTSHPTPRGGSSAPGVSQSVFSPSAPAHAESVRDSSISANDVVGTQSILYPIQLFSRPR
jgi:hypothetical protein